MLNYLSKITLTAIIVATYTSCSGSPKRVELPSNANPNVEISQLDADIAESRRQQVDITSPKYFKQAEKYLDRAQAYRATGKSQQDILDAIGDARGSLNEANLRHAKAQSELSDVLNMREQAITAGAHEYHEKELRSIDSSLQEISKGYESDKGSITQRQREYLNSKYSDLQLKSLKTAKLSRAKAMIENAEKNQASTYAPKTLRVARAKYENAEMVIANNRNDQAAIQTAVDDANMSAEELIKINQTSRKAKGLSYEDVALDLERKRTAAEEAQASAALKNRQLATKNEQLAAVSTENKELQRKETFNAAFEKAQKAFTPDQADVYRQGDQLLIRLKSASFPSGRAELPSETFPVLNKVKDVVSSLQAEKVIVEGHTDSTGTRETNMSLSQKRAKTVANYLSDIVPPERIEAEGFGFEKPLSTNKTKQGRAQNRRVDILITPSQIE